MFPLFIRISLLLIGMVALVVSGGLALGGDYDAATYNLVLAVLMYLMAVHRHEL